MDPEQRERLLLARSDELEREYGDLVRALDAAYEAVRSINAALAENRTESRRVFQERLTVVASPKENGLLTTGRSNINGNRSSNGDAGNGVRVLKRYIPKKLQCSDATPGPTVRLADQALLFGRNIVTGNDSATNSSCGSTTRIASDALIAPTIIYHPQQQRATVANHHVHLHHRRATTEQQQQQQQQQSAARGAYVGDEHSYAVNDGSDEAKNGKESPMAGNLNGTNGGSAPTWHAVFHPDEDNSRVATEEEVTHGEMDLSIVKCEWPDETNDSTCPTSTTTTIASPIVQPPPTSGNEAKPLLQPKPNTIKTIRRLVSFSATLTQPQRRRGRPPVRWEGFQEEDDDLKRKRRQTRDRMRRWRAKKRMERQSMIGKNV